MPRRLGDDPLARARSERARAAEVSTPIALDSRGQPRTAEPGVQSSSRASYNDVFFQRREVLVPQQTAAGLQDSPEISEISQIPEIREAAAASGSETAFAPDANASSAAAPDAGAAQAPPASIVEEVMAKLNTQASSTVSPVAEVEPVKEEQASPHAASEAPSNGGEEAKLEPQRSGGFFRRLFGKFR